MTIIADLIEMLRDQTKVLEERLGNLEAHVQKDLPRCEESINEIDTRLDAVEEEVETMDELVDILASDAKVGPYADYTNT